MTKKFVAKSSKVQRKIFLKQHHTYEENLKSLSFFQNWDSELLGSREAFTLL